MLKFNPASSWSPFDESGYIDTINGIYDYVRAQRVKVAKYPGLLPLIQEFEAWYGALEESHDGALIRHTIDLADVNEAKRRRQAVNDVMGVKLPDDVIPADAPQTVAAPPPPDAMKTIVITGAIGIVGAIVWKLLS